LDGTFSVTDTESDIYKINHADGKSVSVSEDTYALLTKCQKYSEMTDGLFDVSIYPLVKAWGFTTDDMHVPTEKEREQALSVTDYKKIKLLSGNKVQIGKNMQLDLGAAAKGYLSQKIMELFQTLQVDSAIVSLGGNVQTIGKKQDGSEFVVGITDPSDGTSIYGTLQVCDKAVITSGIYQRYFEENGKRYHHIMDKRTGMPAENSLSSVTVISDDGCMADALATALYVMGEKKAIAFQKEHPEMDIILIRKDGTFWQSDDNLMTKYEESEEN
jgi:thiamine biosynthesis lipoprotein